MFDVIPLSKHIGAEIRGLDLSEPLARDVTEALYGAWLKHQVLLFRDQVLTQRDMVRVTASFGEPGVASHPKHLDPSGAAAMHPNVMLVTNIRQDGAPIGMLPDGEMHFHHDKLHREMPDKATLLYAVEIPSRGGDTLFASGYAAYEALEPSVRERLEGKRAFHSYEFNAMTREGKGLGARGEATHPVFRTHEETGRKAVYVNRLMTRRILDVSEDESERLLAQLFAHSEHPEFVYRHAWWPGDLVMWDNRCSMHARTDFPAHERRLMWRTTVQCSVRPQ